MNQRGSSQGHWGLELRSLSAGRVPGKAEWTRCYARSRTWRWCPSWSCVRSRTPSLRPACVSLGRNGRQSREAPRWRSRSQGRGAPADPWKWQRYLQGIKTIYPTRIPAKWPRKEEVGTISFIRTRSTNGYKLMRTLQVGSPSKVYRIGKDWSS